MSDGDLPEIGDVMEDGSVFAGLSADEAERLYVMPEDADDTMKWNEANEYADKQDFGGRNDWRLPTAKELSAIFDAKSVESLHGTFHTASYDHLYASYWSSDKVVIDDDKEKTGALTMNFNNGAEGWNYTWSYGSVRLVRTEPVLKP